MTVEFVDTNVFVYAHDESAGAKRDVAKVLLQRLFEDANGAVSIQVLSEFFWTTTQKMRLPQEYAEKVLADLRVWSVHSPDHAAIMNSVKLCRRYQISWWDALIVNSAIELGCETLWTEDLNDGQQYGPVTARNPFAS